MPKHLPTHEFGHLTDEELLRRIQADGPGNPMVKELCQRLERFLESAPEVSTTRHLCPECDAAILVCIDTQPKPKPKINLRKAPRL